MTTLELAEPAEGKPFPAGIGTALERLALHSARSKSKTSPGNHVQMPFRRTV